MKPPTFHLCAAPTFKVGEPPPGGYLAWFEWARVQFRGGLRQRKTPCCGLWLFPQEFAEHECPTRIALADREREKEESRGNR